MLDSYLVIGEILKPQGVRGEVKARAITNDVMRFAALRYAFLETDGKYDRVGVRCTRIDPDAVYLKLEGVSDRDAAEALRGRFIYVDRENAVKLDKDSNFICDLIGCEGADDEGNIIGTLSEVLQNGASDVYVFNSPTQTVLLPALKRVVLDVDVANKKILLSREQMAQVAVFEEK